MNFVGDSWRDHEPGRARPRHRGLIWLAAAAAGTILATGLVFANRQLLQDQLSVWLNDPDPAAVALGATLPLTDAGEFLYAASNPVLAGSDLFTQLCGRLGSDEVDVLGCYVDGRIVVFDIDDKRLESFEQVAAAHELLHGVWMRMSSDERDRVGVLLEAVYQRLSNDPVLADRLAWYAVTEPGQRLNELHSILGTEIAGLPQELEQHYAEWFSDRNAIVRMSEKATGVFTQLERRSERIVAQLDELERQIDERRDAYQAGVADYEAAVAEFNQRAEQGDFDSTADFEAERAELVAQADALEAEREALQALIDEYHDLLEQANRLERVTRSLEEALDSGPDR